jgi:membrane-associated phospholipid phosphatase
MARNRRIANVDRRVLRTSIAGAAFCLVTFLILRLSLLFFDGPSPLDVWLAEHVRQTDPSRELKILERLAAAPGSRKGAVLLILGLGAWAWLRRRDVRLGALLIAAFLATIATVEILKTLLVRVMPIAPTGDLDDRAFLSSHVAIAVALLGMLVVVIALSGHRALLPLTVAIAIVLVGGVALSVMASDMHYLVDILSGAAVAGFWVCVLAPLADVMWGRSATRTSPAAMPPRAEVGDKDL